VEIPGVTQFAGFIGLSIPRFEAAFTPCVEVGWRLAAEHWGKGYAPEGARAALAFGFQVLGLEEIVSFTVPGNVRSRRVMEKIGLTYAVGEDFDHPSLPAGHPLRRHVLYRLRRARDVEPANRTFDDIFAPLRREVAESGTAEEALDRLLEQAREEVWEERKAR
jgi:RimJ/RimL family protein N-acetyltransferase